MDQAASKRENPSRMCAEPDEPDVRPATADKKGTAAALQALFAGVNAAAQTHWDETWQRIGGQPNLCWYPSANHDFRDLLYLTPVNIAGLAAYPDLFIHTDFQARFPGITDGETGASLPINLYKDIRTQIQAVKVSPLRTVCDLNSPSPLLVRRPEDATDAGRAFLMDVEVVSKQLGTFQRPLLYVLAENVQFFCNVILAHQLPVSHIVNIRDGSGCGGGGHVNMRFLEFFLGFMQTRYLATDNLGRDHVGRSKLAKYDDSQDWAITLAFASKRNCPVSLKAIQPLGWSKYGTYAGDAHLLEVVRFWNDAGVPWWLTKECV